MSSKRRSGGPVRQLSLQSTPRRPLKKQLSEDIQDRPHVQGHSLWRGHPDETLRVLASSPVRFCATPIHQERKERTVVRPRPVKLAWSDKRQLSHDTGDRTVEVVARRCKGQPRPVTAKPKRTASEKDTILYTRQQLSERLRLAWKEREKSRPNLDIFLAQSTSFSEDNSLKNYLDSSSPLQNVSEILLSPLSLVQSSGKQHFLPLPNSSNQALQSFRPNNLKQNSLDSNHYFTTFMTQTELETNKLGVNITREERLSPSRAKFRNIEVMKNVNYRKIFDSDAVKQCQSSFDLSDILNDIPKVTTEAENAHPSASVVTNAPFAIDVVKSDEQFEDPLERLIPQLQQASGSVHLGKNGYESVSDVDSVTGFSDSSADNGKTGPSKTILNLGKDQAPLQTKGVRVGGSANVIGLMTANTRRVNFKNSGHQTLSSSMTAPATPPATPPPEPASNMNDIRISSQLKMTHRPASAQAISRVSTSWEDYASKKLLLNSAPSLDVISEPTKLKNSSEEDENSSPHRTGERQIKSAPASRRRLKAVKRRVISRGRTEDSSGEEDEKARTNRRGMMRCSSAREVVTMVSLLSPAGSETETEVLEPSLQFPIWTSEDKEEPLPADIPLTETPSSEPVSTPPRIVCLRKTPKTVSFQQHSSSGRAYSANYPLRRGAAVIPQEPCETVPIPAPKKKLIRAKSAGHLGKYCDEEQEVEVETGNSTLSEDIQPLPSEPEPSDPPQAEEITEPQFKSAKEKECWELFSKMAAKGVSVSYDTVLRGMLTPTEYRLRRTALLSSC